MRRRHSYPPILDGGATVEDANRSLNHVAEARRIYERYRGDIRASFVTVQDLLTLGLIEEKDVAKLNPARPRRAE